MSGLDGDIEAGYWLDQLSTAVLSLDGELCFTNINLAGETLLSLSRRQVIGVSARELWRQSPDFLQAMVRTLDGGNPCRGWDFHLVSTGGRSCAVDYMLTPTLLDEDINGLVVEMSSAADHARVGHDEDMQSLSVASDSLRGIAHEVRNPLGGIRGAAQLLERELHEPELREYTRIIIGETDRLHQFIGTLLAEDKPGEPQVANIHELLEYVIQLVEADSGGRARIARDYDPSLPEVWVDREKLIRALLNLVLNAWQAVGETGRICVRTRVAHRQTILHVQHRIVLNVEIVDDGKVIPEDIQQGMFYPLVTGRARGTGLGLPIARQLIALHGGVLEYQRVADGNCFRIRIPSQSGLAMPDPGRVARAKTEGIA